MTLRYKPGRFRYEMDSSLCPEFQKKTSFVPPCLRGRFLVNPPLYWMVNRNKWQRSQNGNSTHVRGWDNAARKRGSTTTCSPQESARIAGQGAGDVARQGAADTGSQASGSA